MCARVALSLAGLVFLLAACGPATFTRTRTVYEPVSAADSRQEKDGVVTELKFGQRSELPASFTATVQACDQVGMLMVDKATGRPIAEQVRLSRPGQYWEQVALTNNTDHVIRMNSVVIRLFDPAGSQYEPLSWGDLQNEMLGVRPCASTNVALNQLRVNKVFDRNMEIVPNSTSTFWVPFRPASMAMTGVWRFTIYDVPVKLDAAGMPTRKTQFDMRVASKQVVDTFYQASMLEPARLVSSRDASDSGVNKPAAAATPTATSAPTRPPMQPVEVKPAAEPPKPAAQAPSAPPASTSLALTRELAIKVQTRLNELGFPVGVPDGGFGPRSKAALSKFQASKGLPATGVVSAETLAALGVSAPAQNTGSTPAKPAAPAKSTDI